MKTAIVNGIYAFLSKVTRRNIVDTDDIYLVCVDGIFFVCEKVSDAFKFVASLSDKLAESDLYPEAMPNSEYDYEKISTDDIFRGIRMMGLH